MKNDILQQIDTQFQGMTSEEIDDFVSVLAEKIKEAKKANSASAMRMAALDGRLLHKLIEERGELVISEPILKKERETYLTRNADRRLFGLAPLPEPGGVAAKRRGRPRKPDKKSESAGAGNMTDTQNIGQEVEERWKVFPHLPGTPRKNGGTWLGVKKEEKDRPKAQGAVWDAQEKQWYTPDGLDIDLFAEWMPTHDVERAA